MKLIFTIFTFIVLTGNAFSMAQAPDKLLYKGKLEDIFSNPLEAYFNKQHPKPTRLFGKPCSTMTRGYVATWAIKKKHLYLVKMVKGNCSNNPTNISLYRLFPKQTQVKATWFSGTLSIQKGKQLKYVNKGYQSIYEKEILLIIKKGQVIGEKVVDNKAKQPTISAYKAYELAYPNKSREVIVDKNIYNNIYQISLATGYSVQAIINANPNIDINHLIVGQSVILPKRK